MNDCALTTSWNTNTGVQDNELYMPLRITITNATTNIIQYSPETYLAYATSYNSMHIHTNAYNKMKCTHDMAFKRIHSFKTVSGKM